VIPPDPPRPEAKIMFTSTRGRDRDIQTAQKRYTKRRSLVADMKAWVTKYVKNWKQCHHKPTTPETISPSTPSMRSRFHEAQERQRTYWEEGGPPALNKNQEEIGRRTGGWRRTDAGDSPPMKCSNAKSSSCYTTPQGRQPGRAEKTITRSPSRMVARNALVGPGLSCGMCDLQQTLKTSHRARTRCTASLPKRRPSHASDSVDLYGRRTMAPTTRVDNSGSRMLEQPSSFWLRRFRVGSRLRVLRTYNRWFGLPSKISSRQPRFSIHFGARSAARSAPTTINCVPH